MSTDDNLRIFIETLSKELDPSGEIKNKIIEAGLNMNTYQREYVKAYLEELLKINNPPLKDES